MIFQIYKLFTTQNYSSQQSDV